jgi:hypothetical protein
VRLPEPAVLVGAIPTFLARWRQLDIDGAGAVDASGPRRAGLRIEHGRHPYSGARYQVVPAEPGLAPAPPMIVELVADDAGRVALRATYDGGAIDAEVRRPAAPEAARVRFETPVTGNWLVAGTTHVEVHADLADASAPSLAGELTHPHLRGWMTARVGNADNGPWEVEVVVRARGRGLVRPLAAVVALIAHGAGQRALRTTVEQLAATIERVIDELLDGAGPPPSPDALGRAGLDALLSRLAIDVR